MAGAGAGEAAGCAFEGEKEDRREANDEKVDCAGQEGEGPIVEEEEKA